MDCVEEPDWYLHPSNKMDLVPPPTDPDLLPCSSSEQPVDKLVQICSLKLRNPLNNSGSSIMKACETMPRTSDHEDAESCHWDQSICLRNSESPIGTLDDGSDDRAVTSSAKQLSPLLDATNDKAFLANPVSFVVHQILACSNKELGSDYVPAEELQDLEVETTVENQIREVDNIRSIGVKRKASRDKASCNSKRRNKGYQQSIFADKLQNLQPLEDKRFDDSKCLQMKFLSTHGNLPSKSQLLKRFSVFGKIDASRTNVNPGQSSAKVVFLAKMSSHAFLLVLPNSILCIYTAVVLLFLFIPPSQDVLLP